MESKIDGWRMQIIHHDDGRLEFWGRRLEQKPNWTEKLTSLIPAAKKIMPGGTLLDAELCSDRGRRFMPSLFARKPKAKPIVYIFDVIYFKGKFVGDQPLTKRKKILDQLEYAESFQPVAYKKLTDLKQEYKRATRLGNEGIVIKKFDSRYQVGKEAPIATQDWRKIK